MNVCDPDFGINLLRSFGVDTKFVTSFVLRCDAGQLPLMEVTSAVPANAEDSARFFLQKYELVERELLILEPVAESVSMGTLIRTTHTLRDA